MRCPVLAAALVWLAAAASGCGGDERGAPATPHGAPHGTTSSIGLDARPTSSEPTGPKDPTRPTKRDEAGAQQPVAPSAVQPGSCERACANVDALMRAELAALSDGGKGILAATESARNVDCRKDCLARGDPASVACVSEARSLIELAGCLGAPEQTR